LEADCLAYRIAIDMAKVVVLSLLVKQNCEKLLTRKKVNNLAFGGLACRFSAFCRAGSVLLQEISLFC